MLASGQTPTLRRYHDRDALRVTDDKFNPLNSATISDKHETSLRTLRPPLHTPSARNGCFDRAASPQFYAGTASAKERVRLVPLQRFCSKSGVAGTMAWN
jgi:hypothetical protein